MKTIRQEILFQRCEGAAVFLAATFIYFHSGLNWIAYLLLFFAFDLSMIGYLINVRLGALIYNIVHSFITPSVLVIVYVYAGNHVMLGLISLWFAHIGLDRALGYGLKSTQGFRHTHLGMIGKK